jgi:hypothetical protein
MTGGDRPDRPDQDPAGRKNPAGFAGAAADAAWMKKEMGLELARRRHAAGLSQDEFAALTGEYSRSHLSHAEGGRDGVGRNFWVVADRLLGTDELFASSYDMVRECSEPGRRAPVRGGGAVPCELAMKAAEPVTALDSYRRLGWPTVTRGDVLELVTGKTVEALEVSRAAGAVAAGAWLESGGAEGAVRGLPRLPAPDAALGAIDAGDRWFFLVRRSFPWQPGADRDRPAAVAAQIWWHSGGSRVPLPPSKAGTAVARWAYLPAALLQPPPPLAVLDLLGWAVSMTCQPGMLLLPGGVVAARAPRP